jgi:hypothetical protein
MIITLVFPEGQMRKMVVEAMPRKGEFIRLANGITDTLLVEAVLHEEVPDLPPVIKIGVRVQTNGPKL